MSTATPSPDPGADATPVPRWATASVVLGAVLTFAWGVPNALVATWDDGRFLIDNPDVQRVSLEGLRSIWTEVHFQAWHPLHLLSYWLDVPWSGPSGPVQHGVNLALWCLGLSLLLRVMIRLELPAWAAVLGTLFYGLHPAQVEAVTWATGRKEILVLIFTSLSLLAHLRSERPTDRASWLSRGAYLLAVMAKTTVLPLPGLLFLLDVLWRRVPARTALARQVPALVVGLAFGGLVVGIWRHYEMIRTDAPATGLRLVPGTITHYVTTVAWPASLSPVYPIDRAPRLEAADFVVPALLLGALAGALRAPAGRAAFALAAFLVLLLPVMNIVPVYFQTQDRYLSLPLLPLGLGFGAALAWLGRRMPARILAPVAALIVACYAARTVDYARAWADDTTLWEHATATHPRAFYAWMKLGEHRRDRGDLDGAISAYTRAVEAQPTLKLGHSALFVAQTMRDERDLSLPARAMELGARYHREMDDAYALRGLAGDMVQLGYKDAALVPLARSLEQDPIDDERLERAALTQQQHDLEWLALFYMSQMSRPPIHPDLRALIARTTGARAGD